ncbi:hypothetical protein KC19_VG107500 [Ceratodon purpureus]|uniref:Uncharacterized protein n=1 Tax=Ceratodon purpureus TaxID=3225 RepID=A0A8T0HNX9_CERPU|nr:hypothetical protein KC19_VG107500 [Ceratodon purpureus]
MNSDLCQVNTLTHESTGSDISSDEEGESPSDQEGIMCNLIKSAILEAETEPDEFTMWIDDNTSQEMTRLLVMEQGLRILNASAEDDDYTDWIQWSAKPELQGEKSVSPAPKELMPSDRWASIRFGIQIGDSLSKDQQYQLWAVLERNSHAFVVDKSELSHCASGEPKGSTRAEVLLTDFLIMKRRKYRNRLKHHVRLGK